MNLGSSKQYVFFVTRVWWPGRVWNEKARTFESSAEQLLPPDGEHDWELVDTKFAGYSSAALGEGEGGYIAREEVLLAVWRREP